MNQDMDRFCMCGHERTLHDRHGCAAFLGAFASTAHLKRYCPCDRSARDGSPQAASMSRSHGRCFIAGP